MSYLSEDTDGNVQLNEDTDPYEYNHLATHVALCKLRNDHVTAQLRSIKRILWFVAFILLTSVVSTNIAVWTIEKALP